MSMKTRERLQLEMDPKKRKRMLSNRESARRSRMRKQQHLEDLLSQEARLKNENTQISMQINLLSQNCAQIESENATLRTEMVRLKERLRCVNSALLFDGTAMEIPDQFVEPWKPTCMQSIVASGDMFMY